MAKSIVALLAVVVALAACAPQSRVEQLEERVLELEDLVNEMAELIAAPSPGAGAGGRVVATKVVAPSPDCALPGIALWEKNGKLGCTSPKALHHIEGWDLYFPATKGCIGSYVIMGPESLTCDTPEHPYH